MFFEGLSRIGVWGCKLLEGFYGEEKRLEYADLKGGENGKVQRSVEYGLF